jgi:hypothetical protein
LLGGAAQRRERERERTNGGEGGIGGKQAALPVSAAATKWRWGAPARFLLSDSSSRAWLREGVRRYFFWLVVAPRKNGANTAARGALILHVVGRKESSSCGWPLICPPLL